MMERTVWSGIVESIQVVHIDPDLAFVTLSALDSTAEYEVPVYARLGKIYIGKPVDIINVRSGFFGRNFEQTVEAAEMSSCHRMPYSMVMEILSRYALSHSRKRQF